MVGITSFEVNINAPISLFTSMGQQFVMQIGPNTANCEISHLTISYLILSVYKDCGACGDHNLNDNGTCSTSCPEGYTPINGVCVPKCTGYTIWDSTKGNCVCKDGYYEMNG